MGQFFVTFSHLKFLKTKYITVRNIEVTTNFDTIIGVCATPKIQVPWMWHTHNVYFPQFPMYSNITGCHSSKWLYEFRGVLPLPFSFSDMTPPYRSSQEDFFKGIVLNFRFLPKDLPYVDFLADVVTYLAVFTLKRYSVRKVSLGFRSGLLKSVYLLNYMFSCLHFLTSLP